MALPKIKKNKNEEVPELFKPNNPTQPTSDMMEVVDVEGTKQLKRIDESIKELNKNIEKTLSEVKTTNIKTKEVSNKNKIDNNLIKNVGGFKKPQEGFLEKTTGLPNYRTLGGVGIGAALGTMLLPGIGTFLGGTIGGLAANKAGDLLPKKSKVESTITDVKELSIPAPETDEKKTSKRTINRSSTKDSIASSVTLKNSLDTLTKSIENLTKNIEIQTKTIAGGIEPSSDNNKAEERELLAQAIANRLSEIIGIGSNIGGPNIDIGLPTSPKTTPKPKGKPGILGRAAGGLGRLIGSLSTGTALASAGAAATLGGLFYMGMRKDSQAPETPEEAEARNAELQAQGTSVSPEEMVGSTESQQNKSTGLAQVLDSRDKQPADKNKSQGQNKTGSPRTRTIEIGKGDLTDIIPVDGVSVHYMYSSTQRYVWTPDEIKQKVREMLKGNTVEVGYSQIPKDDQHLNPFFKKIEASPNASPDIDSGGRRVDTTNQPAETSTSKVEPVSPKSETKPSVEPTPDTSKPRSQTQIMRDERNSRINQMKENGKKVRDAAESLGLDPNKVSGKFEGGQLTSIITQDRKEIDVSDRLTDEQRKKVEIARQMRRVMNNEAVEPGPKDTKGADVSAATTENNDLNRASSAQQSGVQQPIISTNTVNNNSQQIVPIKSSPRNGSNTAERFLDERRNF